jgi:hypothetical protein
MRKKGSSSLYIELLNHIGHRNIDFHIEYKINFYVCICYVSYVSIVVQIKNLNYTFSLFLTKNQKKVNREQML